MAGTCSAAHSIVSGRPFIRTSTTGVPVAATASSSCSCTPGRPIIERLAASPLISPRSPRARIATLACRAAATASAKPAVDESSIPDPCAYTTCVVAGTFDLMPCSTVTTSSGWPIVCQGPSGSGLLSARDPITAIADVFLSTGSVDRSFLSSTIDSPATRRASARVSAMAGAVRARYGSLNRPRRCFARRMRMTAESTTVMGIRPARTSAGSESM